MVQNQKDGILRVPNAPYRMVIHKQEGLIAIGYNLALLDILLYNMEGEKVATIHIPEEFQSEVKQNGQFRLLFLQKYLVALTRNGNIAYWDLDGNFQKMFFFTEYAENTPVANLQFGNTHVGNYLTVYETQSQMPRTFLFDLEKAKKFPAIMTESTIQGVHSFEHAIILVEKVNWLHLFSAKKMCPAVSPMPIAPKDIADMCVSSNGQFTATVDRHRNITIVDITSKAAVLVNYQREMEYQPKIAFSPDNAYLFIINKKNKIVSYDFEGKRKWECKSAVLPQAHGFGGNYNQGITFFENYCLAYSGQCHAYVFEYMGKGNLKKIGKQHAPGILKGWIIPSKRKLVYTVNPHLDALIKSIRIVDF